MRNQALKDIIVDRLLPRVQTPAQYIGGEWNAVRKDRGAGCQPAPDKADYQSVPQTADARSASRGTLCLCFPDTYSIGMSCHGVQVLYDVMNRRDDWACERAFTPLEDFEQLLREHRLPLYGLESFTPLKEFDVVGFTLQHDLCYTNVLTMLDLGGIPLHAQDRTMDHPLVIAGGPCASNPEPMARFIDLFVIGDGEEALPEVCDLWMKIKPRPLVAPEDAREGATTGRGFIESRRVRQSALAEMSARLPYAYVPQSFDPGPGCRPAGETDQPAKTIEPAVVLTSTPSHRPPPRSSLTSNASRTASPSRSCAAVRADAASARARP
ncbi:MAG: hypothetical protein ABFC96_07070 [Thermoguttaceae bacterium]